MESENKKLKQSKAILESRINLFETDKQKQTREHIIPDFQPPQAPHQPKCGCHQPVFPSCSGYFHHGHNQQGQEMYDNISHVILNIDVKMTSLIQEFKKFMAPLNSTSQVQSTPENQVPAQTQQKAADSQPQQNVNMGNDSLDNTIEEIICDAETYSNLNVNVLTNQSSRAILQS